jgi:hypothetical protein
MKQLAWAVMVLTAAVPTRADAGCEISRWCGAADEIRQDRAPSSRL